jgi:hypothetical protein
MAIGAGCDLGRDRVGVVLRAEALVAIFDTRKGIATSAAESGAVLRRVRADLVELW